MNSSTTRAVRRSGVRLVVFRAVAVAAPIVAAAAIVIGYATYREMSLLYEYCGPYGVFDDELGWRLQERSASCISLRNRITGEVFFDTRIHVNSSGFRDAAADAHPPGPDVLAVGDSWTFGYGVDYEESYPYLLGILTHRQVANAGVPAYGSAGVLLLLRRTLERARPAVVVYLAKGLWTRSICGEASAGTTLVPCFADISGEIHTIRPAPGEVARAVSSGEMPGGAATAGHRVSLPTRLLKRSLADVEHALGRRLWTLAPNAADDSALVSRVLRHELEELLRLAQEFDFVLLLVDPQDAYRPAVSAHAAGHAGRLVHFGHAEWAAGVESQFARLPAHRVLIPEDWHYTPEANAVIATALAPVLRDALRTPAASRGVSRHEPPSRPSVH